MLAYMVAPGFLVLGLILIPLGMAIERRRRLRQIGAAPALPATWTSTTPRNAARWRLCSSFVVAFSLISAVGSYKAYEFTDSVQFCGQLCHTVMHPEFTAYQASPHARVACVECHVGSGRRLVREVEAVGRAPGVLHGDGHLSTADSNPGAQSASCTANLRAVPLAEEILGRAAEDLHPLRHRRAEHAARDSSADQDRRWRSFAGTGGRRHSLAHEHRQQDHVLCHRRTATDHSLGASGRRSRVT